MWGDLAVAVERTRTHKPGHDGPQGNAFGHQSTSGLDIISQMDGIIAGDSSDPMRLPPLFAVVRLIASTIDQLDIVMDDGSPVPLWLRKPRQFSSALDQGDLLQHVVSAMAIEGHAYLQARKLEGGSWRLDALNPDSVQVRRSTRGIVRLEYIVDGEAMPRVPAWQSDWKDGQDYVLPVPYLVTADHPEGTSPVKSAGKALDGYLQVEHQAASLLEGGTYSGGRLETDSDITQQTALRYQEAWVANRKNGKIPVLGAGLRYVNDVVDARNAQWIESRQANAQQISALYGVPSDLVGLTMAGGGSSLSYSNSVDNMHRFRINCLEAFTSQIEDALSTLLPPGRNAAEQRTLTFDFDQWMEAVSGDTDIDSEA